MGLIRTKGNNFRQRFIVGGQPAFPLLQSCRSNGTSATTKKRKMVPAPGPNLDSGPL